MTRACDEMVLTFEPYGQRCTIGYVARPTLPNGKALVVGVWAHRNDPSRWSLVVDTSNGCGAGLARGDNGGDGYASALLAQQAAVDALRQLGQLLMSCRLDEQVTP